MTPARRRLPVALAAFACVIALSGCTAQTLTPVAAPSATHVVAAPAPVPTIAPVVDPADVPGSWTVLAYEIADTNLEPDMMKDVGEMGKVGTQPGLNIVAMVDRAKGYSNKAVLGIPNWTGAKTLEVGKGTAKVIDDIGNLDTGDPAALTAFITQGIKAYPADHYSLIISDHGASWPGVGGDEGSGDDSLTLAEIHQGIAAGLTGAGVEQLDILGFDACLMATYEVASDLAPLAKRMIASEELEPGHGWDYSSLGYVIDNHGATANGLAHAIVTGFKAQAVAEETVSEITLAVIDLTKMSAVDAAMTQFTSALIAQGTTAAPAVGRSLASTLGFGKTPDPDEDSFMSDLAILAGDVATKDTAVATAATGLVSAIGSVVLEKVDGHTTKGATGLSVYFPPKLAYFDSDYATLGDRGGWASFLSSYYGTGAKIPAAQKPAFTTDRATIDFDKDGVNITGTFALAAQSNLVDAYVRYGTVQKDGSIRLIGKEQADVADDGSGLATGSYDFSRLVISDGEDSTVAFLDLSTDKDGGISADVPMSYYSPDDTDGTSLQDALLSLTLDSASDTTFDETYYAYNAKLGTYGELTTEPEGIIVPQVDVLKPDGTEKWVETDIPGLYSDLPQLDYDFKNFASGTKIYLELVVEDFGGNTDKVSAIVTVP